MGVCILTKKLGWIWRMKIRTPSFDSRTPSLIHRIWKLAATFRTLLFYIFTISFTCKCEDEMNISCLFRVIWVIFSSSFYMENMWNSGCFHVQNLGEIHIYSLSKFHQKFRVDFHMIFMCLNIHDFHTKSTLVVDRGGASFQKHPRGFEQRRKIDLQWNTNARWCTRPVVRKSRSRRAESAFQDCSIVLMAR